jgi:NTE family protein
MEKTILNFKMYFIFIVLALLTSGCAGLKTSNEIRNEKSKVEQEFAKKSTIEPQAPETPAQPPPDTTTTPIQNTPLLPAITTPLQGIPRIGLIFSPGGAKVFGHIGALKEIEKAKWPIISVGGLEWGAAVAASFAHRLSANETEWELSKLKKFEDVKDIGETLYSNKSVADLKVPFVCPSLNISKQERFLLNRGQLSRLIPFCLAHPPLTKAYGLSVADLDAISLVAQHLRSTGAKKIVFLNVLTQKVKKPFAGDVDSAENILYVKAAIEASRKANGVDDIIEIDLSDYSIQDLDSKREIIAKAAELSYDQVLKLTRKYGL